MIHTRPIQAVERTTSQPTGRVAGGGVRGGWFVVRSLLSFGGSIMRLLLSACVALFLLPSLLRAGEAVAITVTNITTVGERRHVTVEVHLPGTISISKDVTLLAIVGTTETGQGGSVADPFGPPQNFALKGTSHEVSPKLFRVSVVLPLKTVTVKFIIRGKSVIHEETREI